MFYTEYILLMCSFTSSDCYCLYANSFPQESLVRDSAAQTANDKNSSAGPRL